MSDSSPPWAAGGPSSGDAPSLLGKLRNGWAASSSLPKEFVDAWRRLFDTPTHSLSTHDNLFEFSTELTNIKLRGMDNILCLCISGETMPDNPELEVWRTSRALGRSIFVMAFTESSARLFERIPRDRCLKLGPHDLELIFTSPNPTDCLKALLRAQFSLRRLIPFDIGHSPQSHMFFGRQRHIDDLVDNVHTSYAIVGPLGIGKTTLLRQYRNLMLRQKDQRSQRVIYLNFAFCTNPDDDFVARYIAMAIEPSARSHYTSLASLPQLIRRLSQNLNGPPELLCDEVDDVCHGKVFQILGSLMREGHCRLLLCGRAQLYRLLTQESHYESQTERGPFPSPRRDGGSTVERRQLPMRLGPLDFDDAQQLITRPVADLGLAIDPTLIDEVLLFTGRIPHLIQYCGNQLVNEAIKMTDGTITARHFDAVRWNFDAGQFFTDPLRNFDTAEAKYLALICLSKLDVSRSMTITELQELAKSAGLERTFERTKALCDDLVINNVLSWAENRYKLATGALSYYARDWGYLDKLIMETKLHLGISSAGR
jgi:hypothetical protein